jgi:hypothetical protein
MAVSEEIIALAEIDFATRFGMPIEQIVVKDYKEVTWSDTSLGFPEEGRLYASVLVPGYRLVLSDGKEFFQYNTDRGTRVVYCADNKKQTGGES